MGRDDPRYGMTYPVGSVKHMIFALNSVMPEMIGRVLDGILPIATRVTGVSVMSRDEVMRECVVEDVMDEERDGTVLYVRIVIGR